MSCVNKVQQITVIVTDDWMQWRWIHHAALQVWNKSECLCHCARLTLAKKNWNLMSTHFAIPSPLDDDTQASSTFFKKRHCWSALQRLAASVWVGFFFLCETPEQSCGLQKVPREPINCVRNCKWRLNFQATVFFKVCLRILWERSNFFFTGVLFFKYTVCDK